MARREQIYEILLKEKKSAQELANFFKVELWEILVDLKRLAKSVQPSYDLNMYPAACKNCGFIFKERRKVKKPTKCPKCKGEGIYPPFFKIEQKEP